MPQDHFDHIMPQLDRIENNSKKTKEKKWIKIVFIILQSVGLLFLFGAWIAQNRFESSLIDRVNKINTIRTSTAMLESHLVAHQIAIDQFTSFYNAVADLNKTPLSNSLYGWCNTFISIKANATEMFRLDSINHPEINFKQVFANIDSTKAYLKHMNTVDSVDALQRFYYIFNHNFAEDKINDIQKLNITTRKIYEGIDDTNNWFQRFYIAGSILLAIGFAYEKLKYYKE